MSGKKAQVVQKLRLQYSLSILLEIAQLPRATFYYHIKRMHRADKYADVKAEITAIYHENKGRYGYFSLFGQKLYLSPILDLHNGYLVSYTISERPVLNMVIARLMKSYRTGLI